jgi:chorismate mutase
MGSRSRSAHWRNGEKRGDPESLIKQLKRWRDLLRKPNLSPEFKAQIERNIVKRGGKV